MGLWIETMMSGWPPSCRPSKPVRSWILLAAKLSILSMQRVGPPAGNCLAKHSVRLSSSPMSALTHAASRSEPRTSQEKWNSPSSTLSTASSSNAAPRATLDWSRIATSGILALYQCVISSLTLDKAEIKGGAFLGNMTATGEVRAFGATIGELNLDRAVLTNPGGIALDLEGAEIKGSVFLRNATVRGEVWAVGATIGRELHLEDANLTNR